MTRGERVSPFQRPLFHIQFAGLTDNCVTAIRIGAQERYINSPASAVFSAGHPAAKPPALPVAEVKRP